MNVSSIFFEAIRAVEMRRQRAVSAADSAVGGRRSGAGAATHLRALQALCVPTGPCLGGRVAGTIIIYLLQILQQLQSVCVFYACMKLHTSLRCISTYN